MKYSGVTVKKYMESMCFESYDPVDISYGR
jgi:hypothetical protein